MHKFLDLQYFFKVKTKCKIKIQKDIYVAVLYIQEGNLPHTPWCIYSIVSGYTEWWYQIKKGIIKVANSGGSSLHSCNKIISLPNACCNWFSRSPSKSWDRFSRPPTNCSCIHGRLPCSVASIGSYTTAYIAFWSCINSNGKLYIFILCMS